MQNTEGEGEYLKKLPRAKCRDGERRGPSILAARHGACAEAGASSLVCCLRWCSIPMCLSPLLLSLVWVKSVPKKGVSNNKVIRKKEKNILQARKKVYDISWACFPCGTLPPEPSSYAVPPFPFHRCYVLTFPTLFK